MVVTQNVDGFHQAAGSKEADLRNEGWAWAYQTLILFWDLLLKGSWDLASGYNWGYKSPKWGYVGLS